MTKSKAHGRFRMTFSVTGSEDIYVVGDIVRAYRRIPLLGSYDTIDNVFFVGRSPDYQPRTAPIHEVLTDPEDRRALWNVISTSLKLSLAGKV